MSQIGSLIRGLLYKGRKQPWGENFEKGGRRYAEDDFSGDPYRDIGVCQSDLTDVLCLLGWGGWNRARNTLNLKEPQKTWLGLLLAIAGTFLCVCIDYLHDKE